MQFYPNTLQKTFDSKVKAYIRVYEPLEVVKCKKCGKVIAEPKELIKNTGNSIGKVIE